MSVCLSPLFTVSPDLVLISSVSVSCGVGLPVVSSPVSLMSPCGCLSLWTACYSDLCSPLSLTSPVSPPSISINLSLSLHCGICQISLSLSILVSLSLSFPSLSLCPILILSPCHIHSSSSPFPRPPLSDAPSHCPPVSLCLGPCHPLSLSPCLFPINAHSCLFGFVSLALPPCQSLGTLFLLFPYGLPALL